MKKFLVGLIFGLLAFSSSSANAQYYFRHSYGPNPHYYGHSHRSYDWVAPAIIGGIVTYSLTRPQPAYVPPPQPVYIERPVVVSPSAPIGYRWEQVLDANCNCYRTVLVPN